MAQNLDTFLAQTQFPEPALAPVKERVKSYSEMVSKSNELVASLNASKTDNANNPEFVDSRWKANREDSAIADIVEQFEEVSELYEKLLKRLRNHAVANYMPEVLDADAQTKARKTVNDMAPTIEQARKGLIEMLSMPEAMLKAQGVEFPEEGLISLLPTAESIKGSGRGRKAASGEGVSYTTRVGDVLIEGKSTQRNGKGKLDYAAEALSERFNGKAIPQNRVTKEELEEALFKAMDKPFRSVKSTELPPEVSFVFEKTIQVQNGNDDSFKEVPQKVNLTVRSVNFGEAAKATTETPETEKVAAKPAETESNSAPAKKTAAPAKPASK